MSSFMKSINRACLGLTLFAICGVEAYWSSPTILTARNWEVTSGMDANGNTTAVWSDWYSRISHIYSANLRKGDSEFWRAPNVVYAAKNHLLQYVRSGTDAMWNGVTLWEEFSDNPSRTFKVRASTRPYGGKWSPPMDVSPVCLNPTFPRLAMNPSGYAVAVWMNQNDHPSVVQAATFSFGSTWSAPVDISDSLKFAREAQVCVDHAGNAVAIWVNDEEMQSASLPYQGTWSAPTRLTGYRSEPQIAISPSGLAVAVWAGDGVYASKMQFGGHWSTPIKIEKADDLSISDCQVAVDSHGNALVLWVRQDVDNTMPFPIFTKRYVRAACLSSSGSCSVPVDLSDKDKDQAFSPRVAFDGSGNAMAVWNTGSAIQTTTRSANGAWSETTNIASGIFGLSSRPCISVDATGYAVINWSNELGSVEGIAWFPDGQE